MNMKICGVIVTWNRYELLRQNLTMLSKQKEYNNIDIIIVDNHSDVNYCDQIKDEFQCFNINYYYLDSNTGGAGGFSFGLKAAHKLGYDWIILMDDDGKPYDCDCFYEMFEFIKNNNISSNDKVLLNSLVISDDKHLTFHLIPDKDKLIETLAEKNIIMNGIIVNKIAPFNGTVVSKGLVKEIGYPNEDFFIRHDEVDYLERARNANAYIATIFSSRYYHPDNFKRCERRFLSRKINVTTGTPFANYYSVRNTVFSNLKNYGKKHGKKKNLKLYFEQLLKILYNDQKLKQFKALKKAFHDGTKGILGKTL